MLYYTEIFSGKFFPGYLNNFKSYSFRRSSLLFSFITFQKTKEILCHGKSTFYSKICLIFISETNWFSVLFRRDWSEWQAKARTEDDRLLQNYIKPDVGSCETRSPIFLIKYQHYTRGAVATSRN